MSATTQDHHQEILDLESSLVSWARALTRDSDEAGTLVRETLVIARSPDQAPRPDESTRAWLHRLFRSRFHSIARDRSFRRSRSNPISADGYARGRAPVNEIAPETRDVG